MSWQPLSLSELSLMLFLREDSMKAAETYAANQDRADREKKSQQCQSDEFMSSFSIFLYSISFFVFGVVVGYIIIPALKAIYGS
jgi:hypothetical protein